MKILLKILVAPFALALSLLTALLVFLFDICAFLLTIASVILAVLGITLFFTPTPIGGIVFLFLAHFAVHIGQRTRHFPDKLPARIGDVDADKICFLNGKSVHAHTSIS